MSTPYESDENTGAERQGYGRGESGGAYDGGRPSERESYGSGAAEQGGFGGGAEQGGFGGGAEQGGGREYGTESGGYGGGGNSFGGEREGGFGDEAGRSESYGNQSEEQGGY